MRRQYQRYKNNLDHKLENLFENSYWVKKSNPQLFENLSSYELSKDEKLVLGFGMNFSMASKSVNPMSIAKSFIQLEKNCDNNISPNDITMAKGCVYAIINNGFKTNIPRRFVNALGKLKKNKNIHITKADKANAVVILDKECYDRKDQQTDKGKEENWYPRVNFEFV